jgi:hypothetical protein
VSNRVVAVGGYDHEPHSIGCPLKEIPSDPVSHRLVVEMCTPAPTFSKMLVVTRIMEKVVGVCKCRVRSEPFIVFRAHFQMSVWHRSFTNVLEGAFELVEAGKYVSVDRGLPLRDKV